MLMSPAFARPLLHTAHLLTFLGLLGTGLLLFLPGLRAVVTGGYSLLIRDTHRWGGVAFVVLPALIIMRCGIRYIFVSPGPRTARVVWQGIHAAVTVSISAVLAVTGFVLWGKRSLPEPLVDGSLTIHDWLTYAVMVLVGIHLLDVGVVAVVTRLQAATTVAKGSAT
jgi:cytochrome b subunit of formate dehydrogenase